jgi:arginine exporter protein ArgO
MLNFKPMDWVFLAGTLACSVVWYAVGDALRALY